MSTDAVGVRTIDGTEASLDAESLDVLPDGERRLRPGDPGFDDATRIWNEMVQRTPALVVQPNSVDEVLDTVELASKHRLLISIKGGGHNIAGLSLADGALTLDMSRMRDVRVDTDARLAHVGAGCLLGDVDRATQEHGLATVLGFVSETGVAGLTLGGGLGYLSRRFGYTVDNLVEVEIITADGRVRRASRESEAELFWALRGGGGNFGVVTEFTFRLHEVGPEVMSGLIAWPAEDHAEDVLGLYSEMTRQAPRELTLATVMRLAPPAPFIPQQWHGKPIVAMIMCHSGDPGRAAKDLARVKAYGKPIVDMVAPRSYVEQQSMMDATQPKGMNYYWKTEFLPRLADDYLDVFRTQAEGIRSPMSQLILFHLEGAINEHADDDGAVGNRDAAFVTGAAGAWSPGDRNGPAHRSWVRAAWRQIRPYSTGGNYINFQNADDDVSRIANAYRGNLERLREVKVRYDPDNLFRVNRNIEPAIHP